MGLGGASGRERRPHQFVEVHAVSIRCEFMHIIKYAQEMLPRSQFRTNLQRNNFTGLTLADLTSVRKDWLRQRCFRSVMEYSAHVAYQVTCHQLRALHPTQADRPPSGQGWVHKIKDDDRASRRRDDLPHACKLGCKDIVSKRAGAPYRTRRSRDWIKCKSPAAIEAQKVRGENWNV